MLRPLFCETEAVIATSQTPTSQASLEVPLDLVLNRLLVPLPNATGTATLRLAPAPGAASRLDVTGNDDSQDFGPLGARITISQTSAWTSKMKGLGTTVPADLSKTFGDGKFPMPIGARSFADDDFVSRLVASGIIEEKLAVDVLMVDFPNPVFSKVRCDLLNVVPEQPLASLTPKAVTDAVAKALASSNLPGAAEFNANRQTTLGTHTKTIKDFVSACGESLPADLNKLFALTVARRTGFFQNPTQPSDDFPKFAVEKFVRDQFFPVSPSVSSATALSTALDKSCRVIRR